jgi:hypothetical protein
MCILLYDLFMLLVALTCYIYHIYFVALFYLMFGRYLCVADICKLVKSQGHFVHIFTRINFLSNQALNEWNKWKTEIFLFAT